MKASPQVRYWLLDPFWGGLDYLAHYGLRLLPTEWASAAGGWLGRLARRRFAAADRRAAANLAWLLPQEDERARARRLTEMWDQAGRTLAEFCALDRFWQEGRIHGDSIAELQQWRAQSRPLVFVFLHMGNWESCAVAILKAGIALRTIGLIPRNRFHHRLICAARARFGFAPVSPDYAGIRAAYQVLARHEAIGFAIDEHQKRIPVLPRFGRNDIPSGNVQHALRMARKFQAILVFAACRRLPGVHFETHFQAIVDRNVDWHDLPEATKIEQINAIAEPWVRERPEHWYMLDQVVLPPIIQRD